MTTYYKGNNIGLSFDGTGWSFNNQAQDFIDTDTFSTPDPEFPTAPVESDNESEQERPNCPPGYIYDETLKQCVPNPGQSAQYYGESTSDNSNPEAVNLIPSDEQREQQIQTKNASAYIKNLKDRGFVTERDGKLYLKTKSFGQTLASGAFARFGLADEPKAKMDRIITDLSRMGAVNLQVDASVDDELSGLTGKSELGIDLADELEISDKAGTFPTYTYSQENLTKGNFDPLSFTGFTPANVAQNFTTFQQYMNSLQKVKTSVADVGADVRRGDTEFTIKEKEKAEIDKAKAEAKKAKAEATKAEMDAVQPGQDVTDDQGNTYTKKDDGKGFVFKAKDPKPVTTVSYQSPQMSSPVQVGPRAGVMAPKPPTGPNLIDR